MKDPIQRALIELTVLFGVIGVGALIGEPYLGAAFALGMLVKVAMSLVQHIPEDKGRG